MAVPQISPPGPPAGLMKVLAAGSAGRSPSQGSATTTDANCAATETLLPSTIRQLPVPVQAPLRTRSRTLVGRVTPPLHPVNSTPAGGAATIGPPAPPPSRCAHVASHTMD